ncbi:MAG: hypothetical protein K0R17_2945 [Rariglobus sp.]|jgi:hypothetical protein|nr:hypothetical protein [Rariglobus sp.]
MQPRQEFSKRYCERHGIDPSDYLLTVFRQALYPHARPFAWLLQQLSPNYFRADYDFIHDVGRIKRFKDYELAVEEFISHPSNRDNPLRTVLRIRVGSGRLRRIVRATMTQPELSAQVPGDSNPCCSSK